MNERRKLNDNKLPAELSEVELEQVVGGGKGSSGSGFGARLLGALWAGSGFNPRNNEWWRTSYAL